MTIASLKIDAEAQCNVARRTRVVKGTVAIALGLAVLLAGCARTEADDEADAVADEADDEADAVADDSSLCDDLSGWIKLSDDLRDAMAARGRTRYAIIDEMEADLIALHAVAEGAGEAEVAARVVDAISALDDDSISPHSWLLQYPIEVNKAVLDACLGTEEEREADKLDRRKEFLEDTTS